MTEVYDKTGRQIYPGDLLRSFHFRGARRKVYYLYHVAVLRGNILWMVPVQELEPTKVGMGGSCILNQGTVDLWDIKIIHGYGPPGVALSYEDRPRIKREVTCD